MFEIRSDVKFIPQHNLGVLLEEQAQALTAGRTKRATQANLRRLVMVLRGLKLVDREVRYIGLGVNHLGEPGLVIVMSERTPLEPAVRTEGQVAP